MKEIQITKSDWTECGQSIKNVNPIFYKLLQPIAGVFKKSKTSFLYSIKYKFGDCLIKNGKMSFLIQAKEKGLANTDYFFGGDQDEKVQLAEFKQNIGNTLGHPLALVMKNYVEVFRKQNTNFNPDNNSSHSKTYFYPLNIIKEGDLFGVWESINMMFGQEKMATAGWDAVAGKSCILSTLPEKFNQEFKRKAFFDIFGENAGTWSQGFIDIANELLTEGYFTEIILIPERYYLFDEDDSIELTKHKMCLREYIFSTGWQQQAQHSNFGWDDFALIDHFNTKDLSYELPLIKHLINIAESRAFILKPVDSHDGHLFRVYEEIFKRFRDTPFRNKEFKFALDYNTPLFFHYEKLGGYNTWGFELTHSPSLEIILPPQRLEQVRNVVHTTVMMANKLAKALDKRSTHVNMEFYVLKNKNIHNTLEIKDLLNGRLKKKVQEVFPEIKQINCSTPPWYFNALLVIEKKI
jgi:hypothetical protein